MIATRGGQAAGLVLSLRFASQDYGILLLRYFRDFWEHHV